MRVPVSQLRLQVSVWRRVMSVFVSKSLKSVGSKFLGEEPWKEPHAFSLSRLRLFALRAGVEHGSIDKCEGCEV